MKTHPTAPPVHWASTKAGTDAGLIPEKLFDIIRPTVIAGFANDVELVKK
jgi:hypothetical protein